MTVPEKGARRGSVPRRNKGRTTRLTDRRQQREEKELEDKRRERDSVGVKEQVPDFQGVLVGSGSWEGRLRVRCTRDERGGSWEDGLCEGSSARAGFASASRAKVGTLCGGE